MAERIIQLATNLSDLSPRRIKSAFFEGGYASEKLDGVWIAAKYNLRGVVFLSSTLGNCMSLNSTVLEQEVLDVHTKSWTTFVLIGELYHPDLSQAEINGMSSKQQEGYASDMELHLHDCLTVEEFNDGKSEQPYEQRLWRLQSLVDSSAYTKLKVIPQRPISTPEELTAFALEVQQRGGEGVCYRPKNAGWESGDRGTNLVRIKEKMTYDLEALGVSGVEAGAKGGLKGVLQVKWRLFGKSDGEVIIQDIRGMKHDQLRAWSENPSLIVGQIVEVEAMKFTAYGMLREPRFKGIREDKAVADL